MKYTLFGFSQEELLKNKIDLADSAILRFFIDFRGTGKMRSEIIKKGENETTYYWLKYDAVIEDFPLLHMKKDAIYRRLKSLVDKEILIHTHVKNGRGSFSYYEVGPKYESLISDLKSVRGGFKTVQGRGKARPPSVDSPTPLGAKPVANNPSTNNPSTISGNTKVLPIMTIKDSQDEFDPKNSNSGLFDDDPTKSGGIVDPHILSILKQTIDTGNYSHKFPNNGRLVSKILRRCISYLKQIKSGEFKRLPIDMEWANKFIRKWPDPKGYKKWSEVRDLVINSITSCMIDYEESRKVGKGLWKAPALDQFFFNPKQNESHGKSMFLKYMNVSPRTATEKTMDFQKNKLPERIQKKLQNMLDSLNDKMYGNNLLQFWSSMNVLHSWYEDNSEDLTKYNEAYHDNGWGAQCGTDGLFFNFVVEFLTYETGGRFPSRVLDPSPSNNYWQRFKAWMLNGHNISLEINEGLMERADSEIKSNEDQRLEIRIRDRMAELERLCDDQGITIPGEELRKKAEKEIAEETKDEALS